MAAIETIYRTSEGSGYNTSHPGGSRLSLTSMLARLERLLEKRRSRMALLEMSDEQLKDLGLSRSDADREARHRFWD